MKKLETVIKLSQLSINPLNFKKMNFFITSLSNLLVNRFLKSDIIHNILL